jgi:4,5-dihydroxyphthalate decarboxylase
MNGQIKPEGIDLHFTCLRPEETFERQVRHLEFDVSEFSLSYLVFLRSRGDWPYVGIPVFLSRFFRHSCIYIHSHAGIERPQDLAGKTVGVPWYPMTAAVWMRALLQHEYDLAPDEMYWLYAQDVFPWTPPAGLSLERLAQGQSLEAMLESGEVAALFTARQPAPFRSGSPNVRRLFPNYRAMEEEYFRRTRLFPIMHTMIVRREIAEQYPWVPASLFNAFEQAKRMCYQDLHETDALRFTLPWLMDEAERTERVMGEDFWPYGLDANRHVVQSLIRYSHEQGLAAREIPIEEIFAPVRS